MGFAESLSDLLEFTDQAIDAFFKLFRMIKSRRFRMIGSGEVSVSPDLYRRSWSTDSLRCAERESAARPNLHLGRSAGTSR